MSKPDLTELAREVMNAAHDDAKDKVRAAEAAYLTAPAREELVDAYLDAATTAWNSAPDAKRKAYSKAYNAAKEVPLNIFMDLLDEGVFQADE